MPGVLGVLPDSGHTDGVCDASLLLHICNQPLWGVSASCGDLWNVMRGSNMNNSSSCCNSLAFHSSPISSNANFVATRTDPYENLGTERISDPRCETFPQDTNHPTPRNLPSSMQLTGEQGTISTTRISGTSSSPLATGPPTSFQSPWDSMLPVANLRTGTSGHLPPAAAFGAQLPQIFHLEWRHNLAARWVRPKIQKPS